MLIIDPFIETQQIYLAVNLAAMKDHQFETVFNKRSIAGLILIVSISKETCLHYQLMGDVHDTSQDLKVAMFRLVDIKLHHQIQDQSLERRRGPATIRSQERNHCNISD